ncbi:MAG: endonuclease/exonuclease/phosphatase family protein [Gemmatimonadaceae bacterium]
MTPSSNAHRAEFTVRCACGIEYHTSDAHIGRLLPCKCGRKVKVERPADTARAETKRTIDPAPKKSHKTVKRRRRSTYGAPTYEGDSIVGRVLHDAVVLVASTFRPLFGGSRKARTAAYLSWGYFAVVIVLWAAIRFLSENALLPSMIAYGPRWIALLPLLLLVPFVLMVSRRLLFPLAIGGLICVFPFMGGRIAPAALFRTSFPALPEPGTFRLLTFNVEGGVRLAAGLQTFIRDEAPDVVAFQECAEALWQALDSLPGWHAARHGTLCTGSRWPIGEIDIMPRADFADEHKEGFGGSGLVMRTFIASPHGPIVLVNLHLETARRGLQTILGEEEHFGYDPTFARRQLADKPQFAAASYGVRFERNAAIRRAESQRASIWSAAAKGTPLIIAGDFNLPVESTIFQDFWRQYNDAFEERGNGFGWSKREGPWLNIRIDHVLTTDAGVRPLRIKTGHDYLSDHLPVVVDLAWPTAGGSSH